MRLIVCLHYLAGFMVDEVADVLGVAAGDPPLGASLFPTLAPVLPVTCPLLVTLPDLLGLTQYVPLF